MPGCHIPIDRPTRLDMLEERVDKIEQFVFYPVEPKINERICDKCNGSGVIDDDSIL